MCNKCGCLCTVDKSSPHLQVTVILLRVVSNVTSLTCIGFGVWIIDLAFNSLAQFTFVPTGLPNGELWSDTFNIYRFLRSKCDSLDMTDFSLQLNSATITSSENLLLFFLFFIRITSSDCHKDIENVCCRTADQWAVKTKST